MANGNGTVDQYDSSPLSKHIRPIVALCSFIVFAILAAAVVWWVLNKGGEMQWVVAILGIFAACFLYYFNVRSQDKQLEKFINLTGKIGGWGQTPPKANGGTPTSGGVAAISVPSKVGTAATIGDTWNIPKPSKTSQGPMPQPPPLKPFNQADFDASLVRAAESNRTWKDGWGEGVPDMMAAVAYHVFTSLPPYGLVSENLKYLKATIPYIERWFKYAWFGNPDFDCGGTNCLAYALDQKACACGDDAACKHITEPMKVSKGRLTYCYDLRTKWSNAGG